MPDTLRTLTHKIIAMLMLGVGAMGLSPLQAAPTSTALMTVTHIATPSLKTHSASIQARSASGNLSLNPDLSFGFQTVGTTSSVQTATLQNTGSADAALSSTLTGDFALISTDCPSILPANSSCSAIFSFTPTTVGPQSGTLTVTDGNSGASVSISLTGTGLAPVSLKLSPNLVFATQATGTTSPTQQATLQNISNSDASINATVSGPFVIQSTSCGYTVSANSSCTVDIAFAPTVAGSALTGSLTVNDTVTNTTVSITLQGDATQSGSPTPTLSPSTIYFGPLAWRYMRQYRAPLPCGNRDHKHPCPKTLPRQYETDSA